MKLSCFLFNRLALFLARKMPEVNATEHISGRGYRFINLRFINLLPLFAIPDESQP